MEALQLTEYIVKDGNAKFIKDLHKNIFIVRALEEFNHFSENTDRGKPIRGLAKRVTELINDSMKNIDALIKQTKQKRQMGLDAARHQYNEDGRDKYNRDPYVQQQLAYSQKMAAQDRPQDFQKNYFKDEFGGSNAGANRSPDQRKKQPAQTAGSPVIDPKLYQHPSADKEVLNLVESQFGKGFLELNFDDDDTGSKTQTKQPVSNPGNKKAATFEFDFDNGSKSTKNTKGKPCSLPCDPSCSV